MIIQKGRQVSFDYTLAVDGAVVDSSKGKEPFQYTHGEEKIIPGLSRQLEGLKAGDEKKIEVASQDAYGAVKSEALQEVSKSELPSGIEPKVGMPLQVSDQTGKIMVIKIAEVKESTVVMDFNHPLAGKTLTFDVKIVSVK